MEEPSLRRYIQTVSERLLPLLKDLPDAEARIRHVCEQPESGKVLVEALRLGDGTNPSYPWPEKDTEVAKRNREDGNAAFQVRK